MSIEVKEIIIPINKKTIRPNPKAGQINQEMQTLWMHLQSKYLYEYEDTNINCKNCDWVGKPKDLLSEECEDRYSYDDEVCPKCGIWNCCEFQYESLFDWQLAEYVKLNEI